MTHQELAIQCNKVLHLYSIGDIAELRLLGPSGVECQTSISGDAVVEPLQTHGHLPMTVRIPLSKAGKAQCEVTAGGQTAVTELFVNPAELLKGGETETRCNGYQRYGNIVNEFYVARFREIARKRTERIAKMSTQAEAEAYVQEVRGKIRRVFALDQLAKTPLNAKTVSVHEFPCYRMENIIFESRPGFYVTGNLYLPTAQTGKVPCSLIPCGHSFNGKSSANYTKVAATLASNGVAAFCFDPMGQGERFQYSDYFMTENVYSHNQVGKKLLASGSWFGAWRAWDAVRALDYLLSRSEVDANQAYITGCSGGGTLTTWMTAIDDRLKGALPSSYITSWRRNVENELSADAEQTPPLLAGEGLEMGDFLIAAAPRNLCVLDTDDDFFDPRGLQETLQDVRKVYRLLGAENAVDAFIGHGGHGYNPDQREKCYQAMAQWTGLLFKNQEAELVFPTEAQQRCTSDGHIWSLPGHTSAEQLLKQRYDTIIASRKPLEGNELVDAVRRCLGVAEQISCPEHRVLRVGALDALNITTSRMLIETDRMVQGELRRYDNRFIDCFHTAPAKSALLYLPHWNSPMEFPAIVSEMQEQYEVYYSFDPFGVGSLTPAGGDYPMTYYGAPYWTDYHFDSLGLMLGESYQGRRVEAVLNAITYLRDAGIQEITLCGAGRSSVTATFAALLAGDQVNRTLLVNPLESYESLVGKFTDWAQAEMPFGILKITDLPELRRQIHAEVIRKPYINVK